MQVSETLASSIPVRLLPKALKLLDDCPTETFDECLAHSSLGPAEQLQSALLEHPHGSNERATAIQEMREFLSLVEINEGVAA